MTRKLEILLTFSVISLCALGSSIHNVPNLEEQVDAISLISQSVSYEDILLGIFSLLILIPFVYLVYLRYHELSDTNKSYHFNGEYNAKRLIEYVEELEIKFGKRFSRFKKSIELYDKDSAGNLEKHAEVIDSIFFCIKLNGRKRLAAFWDTSDIFLKVLILMLPTIGVLVVLISHIYFGLSGFLLSCVLMIFILPINLLIFSYFLQFSQYLYRKSGKALPALSLALFAVDALIDSKVVRSFDQKTMDYFYFTMVHQYNNMVNIDSLKRGGYIQTSSSIYGNLKEQAVGEK